MKSKIYKMTYSNTDYLSRDKTESLKGWLSMGVLFHHIFQSTHIVAHDGSVLGFLLGWLGAYCVSMFFFISGYGLMVSFTARGGGYLNSYHRNRVLPLFAINAFLVLIYAVQKCLFGEEVTVSNVVLSFFYGGDIVSFGWYLLCIMVFYELFYVSARFFSRKYICMSITVMTLLYIALAMTLKISSHWYQSCLAFPVGVIFAHYKVNLDAVIRRHHVISLLLCWVLYLSSFVFLFLVACEHSSLAIIPHFPLLRRLVISVHGVFFVFVVIGALTLIDRCSHTSLGVTRRLSTIYLEIYVMQGLAFALLRSPWWSVDNDCLYAVFSVLLTLALATAIRPVFLKIISLVKTV